MKHKITLKLAFLLLLFAATTTATIHYVSPNGNNIFPYLSWEDASTTIQPAIDACTPGTYDTVLVDNATYFENLIIDRGIYLIGLSMDSTIVDDTNLSDTTIFILNDSFIKNFTILTGVNATAIKVKFLESNLTISNCIIKNANTAIDFGSSSGTIDQVIINNGRKGVLMDCPYDTCYPNITNSVIISSDTDAGIKIVAGGNPTITNNIIIGNESDYGIYALLWVKTITIRNNIVSGFHIANIETRFTDDEAIIENNVTTYQTYSGAGSINADSDTEIRNNIVIHNRRGISADIGVPVSDYNLFWDNVANTDGEVIIDSTDVLGDPMFVNDTIPTYGGNYDYHLQKYSPAINAGDPNILDVDSSRSDIGLYIGGTYTYENYAPRPPVNLMANVEGGFITLTWNKNSEADTAYYNVYRDTSANFTIDSTNLISSTTDTFYLDPVPKEIIKLYYKITAVDVEGLESEPSEEAVIILTVGTDEWQVINNYVLYQNYPNPFNPSTKIGYKLVQRGYVKLLVYDITGSLVTVLVNQVQEAGYYEVEFSSQMSEVGGRLSSGIYLYRIEVIGEGNIPKFSDMKKMILLK